MNKQRRKELKEQIEKLDDIKKDLDALMGRLEDVKTNIESIKDDEEMAYDNLPESLQDGEKGSLMQDAMNSMEDAIDGIDFIIDELNGMDSNFSDAIDRIDEAIQC